jgi:hypothetical protein
MILFMRDPAMLRIAFDIIVMPCRNNASPPASPSSMGTRDRDSYSILKAPEKDYRVRVMRLIP